MIKDWCAEFAYWRNKRNILRAEFWADVAEWFGTHFTWDAIRARRQRRKEIFDDPDRIVNRRL